MKSVQLFCELVGGLAAMMLPWVLLAYIVGVWYTLMAIAAVAAALTALLTASTIIHHFAGEDPNEW
jgi:hypothetical protein